MNPNQIRALFDAQTLTVFQAYSPQIALPALGAQKFVAPFSFGRMTWIKPSFLWLMERSTWGRKAGQEQILAVKISRDGWEKALSLGVTTSFEAKIHRDSQNWRDQFEAATVHVQWDPERSIRGADLGFNSIQVGISRHLIREFNDDWLVEIEDLTPLARKIRALMDAGKIENARRLLPVERIYKVENEVARRLDMI